MTDSEIATQKQIHLQSVWPLPIRVFLGATGALCCFLTIKELSPALWPFSFLTVFIGFMMFCSLGVGLSLILGAFFGGDEKWTIEPGKVTLQFEFGSHIESFYYTVSDFTNIECKVNKGMDHPDTYFLCVTLKPGLKFPTFQSPDIRAKLVNGFRHLLSHPFFSNKRYREAIVFKKLRSPHNQSLTLVEDALTLFLSK